jgi:hypothetical protein
MGIEGEIRRKTMTSVHRGFMATLKTMKRENKTRKTHHPTKQITLI